ncbi:hypothetical protein AVEN_219247-1 [Araneus ventricosus]|uniref:Uncharacterized protein n=1 Tax=Araneus ventricosus TaxID=182803 RepID=A0A4Y2ESH8_ARAVE|nr:hypothetical protein AVEN_219247-1 [Araneus ventricosus]
MSVDIILKLVIEVTTRLRQPSRTTSRASFEIILCFLLLESSGAEQVYKAGEEDLVGQWLVFLAGRGGREWESYGRFLIGSLGEVEEWGYEPVRNI